MPGSKKVYERARENGSGCYRFRLEMDEQGGAGNVKKEAGPMNSQGATDIEQGSPFNSRSLPINKRHG